MLYYKVVPRKSPRDKSVKYYGSPALTQPLSLDDIADAMADGSTTTSADFRAVLDRFERKLVEKLIEGHSVRLGLLGSFHVTFRSKGAETKDKFTADNIKRVLCRFRPGKQIVSSLRLGEGSKIHFAPLELAAPDGD